MAFNHARFSVLSGGQTGAALLAKYDGTGFSGEGGDSLTAIRAKNFFTGKAVKDALRMAQSPQTGGGIVAGKGLPCLIHARTGMEWRLLIFDAADSDEVTTVGGGGAPAWAID